MSMRQYNFRAEPEDVERWAALAYRDKSTLSEWIREAALRREAEDAAPVEEKVRSKIFRSLLRDIESQVRSGAITGGPSSPPFDPMPQNAAFRCQSCTWSGVHADLISEELCPSCRSLYVEPL